MKKLVCKHCGNAEFTMLQVGEALCKCGLHLTKIGDYRWEKPQYWRKQSTVNPKLQAEVIAKISLLKREIDKCLDERDEEGFRKRTFELKVCQHYLEGKKKRIEVPFRELESESQSN